MLERPLSILLIYAFLYVSTENTQPETPATTTTTIFVHKPTELFISKETTGSVTNPSQFHGEIMCVRPGSGLSLGGKSDVKFIYVDTKYSNPISNGLKKYESSGSSPQAQIELLTDVTKSVVFTLKDVYKIILVSVSEDKCYDNYLISKEEKNDQYVHLTHIKCIPIDEVKVYHEKTSKSATPKKPYVVGAKHICFVATMLTEPICIEASDKTKSYTIIISPYSKPAQKCTTPSKSCISPTNTTTNVNGTETAKQSATPIIISVVVIIAVIMAGGVGYFMMKK